MPSCYLRPADCAAYGVPDQQTKRVPQASTLIDMFLKRPEGLVWVPDAAGNPCYMKAASAALAVTATGTISPGANVVVPVTGPWKSLQVGDAVVLDRANPSVMETIVIQAINATSGALTLRTIANAHGASALLETGLVIQEQKQLPKNRPITTLTKFPIVRVVSGSGRYGYGRRGEGTGANLEDFNLLAALSQFGGPPAWEVFDAATADYDAGVGTIWIPAGVMLAYYTEVRVRYLAGFTEDTVPGQVRQACAMLLATLEDAPNLGAVKSYRSGDTAIERFSDTMISGDIKDLLIPYAARSFV